MGSPSGFERIRVTRSRPSRVVKGAAVGALLVLTAATGLATQPPRADAATQTYVTTSNTTWTVPAGVTSATFDVVGARGGDGGASGTCGGPSGGAGDHLVVTADVTPGQEFTLNTGDPGGNGGSKSNPGGGGGQGYGHGGSGNTGSVKGGAGAGGGAGSSVGTNGQWLAVAGGGGGGGGAGIFCAGDGGIGNSSGAGGEGPGAGSAGSGFRSNDPNAGGGGNAASSSSGGGGGGGGGGWQGGNGGGGGQAGGGGGGGGGGGQSYTLDSALTSVTRGPLDSNVWEGYVKVTYNQVFSTTTSISSTTSSAVAGTPVTFHVAVAAEVGGPAIDGSVALYVGPTLVAGPVAVGASGTVDVTALDLPAGDDTVMAKFSAANPADLGDSQGSTTFTVVKGSTNVLIAGSGSPTVHGQAATFTASVSVLAPSTGVPDGFVQFRVDGSDVGAPIALSAVGQAALTTSTLAIGTHQVIAQYLGSPRYAAATSAALAQQVNQGSSTVSLTSTANPSVVGQHVDLVAHVMRADGSSDAPTGTVQFKDGSAPLDAPVVVDGDGTATMPTTNLALGDHPITAVYSGDSNRSGATSAPLTQVVNAAGTSIDLMSNVASSIAGSAVTFTAQVQVEAASTSHPTGSVVFTVNGVPIGDPVTVDPDGSAHLTTEALPAGTNRVLATFTADPGYENATSAPIDFEVSAGNADPELTVSSNPSPEGSSATFTLTLVPIAPFTSAPTGTVQFFADGMKLGAPATVQRDGSARVKPAPMAVGSHIVTARYSGDLTYQAIGSPTLPYVVTAEPSAASSTGRGNAGSTATGSPGSGSSGLPVTGAAAGLLGGVGLVLLVGGALLLAGRRRIGVVRR